MIGNPEAESLDDALLAMANGFDLTADEIVGLYNNCARLAHAVFIAIIQYGGDPKPLADTLFEQALYGMQVRDLTAERSMTPDEQL